MSRFFLDCFREIVNRNGDKTAILHDGRPAFSYNELDERARAIAALLRQSGAGPETVIGLCFDKSPDYIAALLGIWYAGAAFLPLDPKLPRGRLTHMATESGVATVISQGGCEPLFDDLALELLPADSLKNAQAREYSAPALHAQTLAYIIFTSGSTGQPKGVMVTHAGIVNFLQAQIATFGLSNESRALFYLSHNFDASVSDIGTALLSGATLLIENPKCLQIGPEFAALLASRRITHMDIPPSMLRLLNRSEMPDSLETIIIGGEVCPPHVVRHWAERYRVVNVYGPTEATVCTSLSVCDPDTWDRPLIGQPIPGVTYHLLDDQLDPSPPGVAAELFIGGVALARGYVNRPELTAQKFILREGERLYRTGDLVIEHKDGEYEFLGRVDRQVKVRGLLIEPEEIEARLIEHSGVRRACVIKRPLSTTCARQVLVAFIEAGSADVPSAGELRRHLATALPRWMLPQRYEVLDALPLTDSGKVDGQTLQRRLLESRSGQGRDSVDISAEASILREAWLQVFGVEEIGLDDDFFELGGDSFAVLETVVAAEVRGLTIPPDLVMTNSRFGDQVNALHALLRADDSSDLPPGAMRCEVLRNDVQPSDFSRRFLESASLRSGLVETVPENIFLTGATGFLGSYLLVELLIRTSAKIHCLVRADDEPQARARISKALATYGKEPISHLTHRIVPVPGDIEKPRFGMDDLQWNRLAETVDTVYHLAAHVNMLLPYEALRKTNVGGTEEVVRFMGNGRKKYLHYASTLSVFVATDQNTGLVREDDYLSGTTLAFGGYAQTKWATEVYLRLLAEAAGPISYYRLGLITGDSTTGLSSPTDFLSLFVRGLASVGCVPATCMEMAVDVTPVDFAAAAMAHVSLATMAARRASTYHLANSSSLSVANLIRCMRKCGLSVAEVSPEEFLLRVGSVFTEGAGATESAACLALCRGLSGDHDFERFRTMDLFQATGIEFDMTNTHGALADSGLACPPPADELVLTYVREALKSGSAS